MRDSPAAHYRLRCSLVVSCAAPSHSLYPSQGTLGGHAPPATSWRAAFPPRPPSPHHGVHRRGVARLLHTETPAITTSGRTPHPWAGGPVRALRALFSCPVARTSARRRALIRRRAGALSVGCYLQTHSESSVIAVLLALCTSSRRACRSP